MAISMPSPPIRLVALLTGLAATMVVQLGVAATAPTELLQLQDRYKEEIEEKLEPLKTSFISKLDELEKRLAGDRKIEEALLVREQRTAIALNANTEIPTSALEASEAFADLAEIYIKHRDSRTRRTDQTYLEALKKLESKLIRERRLDGALVVKKEVDRLETKVRRVGPKFGEESKPESLLEHLTTTSWTYEVHVRGKPVEKRTIVFGDGNAAKFLELPDRLTWEVKGREVTLRSPSWQDRYTVLRFDADFETFEGENSTRTASIKGSGRRVTRRGVAD